MIERNVKSLVALQMINNQLLKIIDSNKDKKEIKLEQILNQLYEPYEKIEPNYRSNHSFFNQYQLISSLYSYIVLPKETYFDSIPNEIGIDELDCKWGLKKITEQIKLKAFIRHMRNSISHGMVEFTNSLDFRFIDNNKRNSDNFEITLSAIELNNFINALAYWCITKDLTLKNM